MRSHVIPSQLHGVKSESVQLVRTCIGSVVMAAFSANRERPSELSEEVKEKENVKMQRSLKTIMRTPPFTNSMILNLPVHA